MAIINHLSKILELYASNSEENFLLTTSFSDYFQDRVKFLEGPSLLFSLAYEAKDFGVDIMPNENSEYIFKLFSTVDQDIDMNYDSYRDNDIRLFYLARSIFRKYFVFSSMKDYKAFFLRELEKGKEKEEIRSAIQNSFIQLYESNKDICSCLYGYQSRRGDEDIPFEPTHYTSFLDMAILKERQETYALLQILGDPDSKNPNIDSSYVYVDQANNLDFFRVASLKLFEWCNRE